MIALLTAAGTGGAWDVTAGQYPAQSGAYFADPMWVAREQCFGRGEGSNIVWQGIGYPAAVFPMRPSVLKGWEETVRLLSLILTEHPDWYFVLDGYSQGALVVCLVWQHEILNPTGRLHKFLNRCLGVIAYGNPMRAPGIAYGNTVIWGRPVPGKEDGEVTGGIAGPANLRPEECVFPKGHPLAGQPAVYDFALLGDLYAAAPVGSDPWEHPTRVGENETLIYEAVMDFNGGDILAFARKIFKLATLNWLEFWAVFQAIFNGIKFLGAGMNAPHWQYDSRPVTAWLERLGKEYA
ncbi:lysin B [Mycobacterium phage Leopard]|uniref:Lysin B n=1 Tax=Mycobacterium phage Onyinye TaxID=2686235 RepID=A0A6B9L9H7_9CAUD|nr:endolysin [Mycobacterium phage Onyinye]QHB37453.1 lysin B [Mycobacterium phage Onyinye]UOW92924.1 lysin B [Mycobacterium phage Leopard]WKW85208.1 lysin B [Mycobacterium phage Aikoy]